MNLFLEAVDLILEILDRLSVLRKSGSLSSRAFLRKLAILDHLDLFLAGQNVHREFLIIYKVGLIHLVQGRDILHEEDLMLLQGLGHLLDVGIGAVVLDFQFLHLFLGLFKDTEETFFFFLIRVEVSQITDNAGEHVAHLAEVTRLDSRKSRVREIGHLLLGAGSVLEYAIGVRKVDLLRKGTHLLLFTLCQNIRLGRRRFRGLGLSHRGCRFRLRAECQLRNLRCRKICGKCGCVEFDLICIIVVHGISSLINSSLAK